MKNIKVILPEICDKLNLAIPTVLEMALDKKLPLWVELTHVDIFTEKKNHFLTRKQVSVRIGDQVLSDLNRMVSGGGSGKHHIDTSWDTVFKKVNGTYQPPVDWPYKETYPVIEGPFGAEFSDVEKLVLTYGAMLAYNEDGESIAVTVQNEKGRVKIKPSHLFAYLSDVERLEIEHGDVPVNSWDDMAHFLGCAPNTVKKMDQVTGYKYVTRPGSGKGRSVKALSTELKLEQMRKDYIKIKKN